MLLRVNEGIKRKEDQLMNLNKCDVAVHYKEQPGAQMTIGKKAAVLVINSALIYSPSAPLP